jgi:hypothetical protein
VKTRSGFVSNSSSTSFMIVCKEEDHKKALEKLHPYYVEWIRQMLTPKEQKFAGQDVLVSYIYICSEDDEPIEWTGKYPKEAEDYYDDGNKSVPGADIMTKYINQLKKISKDVIVVEEGH